MRIICKQFIWPRYKTKIHFACQKFEFFLTILLLSFILFCNYKSISEYFCLICNTYMNVSPVRIKMVTAPDTLIYIQASTHIFSENPFSYYKKKLNLKFILLYARETQSAWLNGPKRNLSIDYDAYFSRYGYLNYFK